MEKRSARRPKPKEKEWPDTVKAPPGKYRVVEIDVGLADGLTGDPKECATVVGDYQTYRAAVAAARRRGDGPRQVHNASGKCLRYFS